MEEISTFKIVMNQPKVKNVVMTSTLCTVFAFRYRNYALLYEYVVYRIYNMLRSTRKFCML